jgi:hypothetical protein
MAPVRKIVRAPASGLNYYLVDACFLANKYIDPAIVPVATEQARVQSCHDWWREIDAQLNSVAARVYVPDLCIAEAFKVLAKKYYTDHWFQTAVAHNNARLRMSRDIRTDARTLKAQKRRIRYHDVSTNRDIIISVDRFYELFMKNCCSVQIVDLVLVATAKYLMDFYDIPYERMHIVTLDRALRRGTRAIAELPSAYDPTLPSDTAAKVFE